MFTAKDNKYYFLLLISFHSPLILYLGSLDTMVKFLILYYFFSLFILAEIRSVLKLFGIKLDFLFSLQPIQMLSIARCYVVWSL